MSFISVPRRFFDDFQILEPIPVHVAPADRFHPSARFVFDDCRPVLGLWIVSFALNLDGHVGSLSFHQRVQILHTVETLSTKKFGFLHRSAGISQSCQPPSADYAQPKCLNRISQKIIPTGPAKLRYKSFRPQMADYAIEDHDEAQRARMCMTQRTIAEFWKHWHTQNSRSADGK